MPTGEAIAQGTPPAARDAGEISAQTGGSEVLGEQVRLLHDNAPLSQLVALINSGILAFVQWSQVQHITLALWLLGIGVVSLARLSQSYAFRRARPEGATIGRWRNSFLVGALASGVLWGAAGVLFFPEQSFPHQVFTSFVVAGMIAGSVATLSPVLAAFILFALPAMAPIAVQFLLRGGEIYFSMSVMAMLYGLAMVAIAKHVNATLRTSLGLSQRNSQLIAVLVESKARTETLNRSLETEAAEHRQKEVALRQSETMLAEAQKMAHLGSWTYDPHTRQTVWSAEAFRIYGTDEGSAIPSCRELIARIHREDRSRVQRSMLRAAQHGEPYETEFRILTPAQGVRWIHALCQPEPTGDGGGARLRGTVLDITERKSQQLQLESERRMLEAIAKGSPLPEVLDLLCRLVEELSGWTLCAVHLHDQDSGHLELAAAPSLVPELRNAIARVPVDPLAGSCGAAAWRSQQVIVSDLAADPLWQELRSATRSNGLRACWSLPILGGLNPVLGTFTVFIREARNPSRAETALTARIANIAKIAIERHESEQRIRQLAHYDGLTGLPNRAQFNQVLDHALSRAQRAGTSVALLFVDVDRFKNINDTLGHDAGDRMLREVAARLRQCLRTSDVVARFGGDEFIVMLEDVPDGEHAASVAAKVLMAVAEPLTIGEQELHVTASIGISTYPADGSDLHALQKHADIAMYRAKEQGRNSWRYYSPQADTHSLERLTLEAQLRRALERNELILHYQPKQDIASGRVTGVEALLRWQHPDHGLVPPGDFIPLAEETGLIVSMSEWVLRKACEDAARLPRLTGGGPMCVAVNLSARQFSNDRLIEVVSETLLEFGLEASLLEMEVTESLVMHNAEHAARLLARLKQMGMRVAMDDFGTGYSSLAYLKRFPIDTIKIDRSFIQGLPGDSDDATLTQAIIAMAHSLRLKTVAEGVETPEQLEFLRKHGCDEIQGYYFSQPLPFAALLDLLREHRAKPSVRTTARASSIAVWP
jgi:diguanylate cyclase (GGDEF)-like protein/PAS domain S-box-containing protein